MKKEISPLTFVGVAVVVAIGAIIMGYKMLRPAPYAPSPGVQGVSGATPGVVNQATPPSAGSSTYYPTAPPNSIPGKPNGLGR